MNAAQRAFIAACALLVWPLAAAPLFAAEEATDRIPPMFEDVKKQFSLDGTITTSDGKSYTGAVVGTVGRDMTIFDRQKRRYVDFALSNVARIDVAVEDERDEPYWYWAESGSDEKVYTGKTYPVRKYLTTVTLADGKEIVGDMSGPVNIRMPDGTERFFVLRKTHKGEEGRKLSDLVYVKSIIFGARRQGADGAQEPPADDDGSAGAPEEKSTGKPD